MENNNKKVQYILLAILIIIIVLIIITVNIRNNQKKDAPIIVSNASTFYTVENCINRYLTALFNANTNDLYKLLDDEYIKNNKITINNVMDYLPKFSGMNVFKPIRMYQQYISDDKTNYYAYGSLKSDAINSSSEGTDFYIIVNIHKVNDKYFYSIKPYDGKIFKDGKL